MCGLMWVCEVDLILLCWLNSLLAFICGGVRKKKLQWILSFNRSYSNVVGDPVTTVSVWMRTLDFAQSNFIIIALVHLHSFLLFSILTICSCGHAPLVWHFPVIWEVLGRYFGVDRPLLCMTWLSGLFFLPEWFNKVCAYAYLFRVTQLITPSALNCS